MKTHSTCYYNSGSWYWKSQQSNHVCIVPQISDVFYWWIIMICLHLWGIWVYYFMATGGSLKRGLHDMKFHLPIIMKHGLLRQSHLLAKQNTIQYVVWHRGENSNFSSSSSSMVGGHAPQSHFLNSSCKIYMIITVKNLCLAL